MLIIIGLGNPGKKFEHTRHNAGFEALDFFATQKKDDVILFKPGTFMNESGPAIKKMMQDTGAKIEDLVVVHDDIDMDLGKIKLVKNSTSGGHKGVESIIQALGTKDFTRLKIGVKTDERLAEEVVLEKFTPEEYEILTKAIEQSAEILKTF